MFSSTFLFWLLIFAQILVVVLFLILVLFFWLHLRTLKTDNHQMTLQLERVHTRMNALEVAITKIDVKESNLEKAMDDHFVRLEEAFVSFKKDILSRIEV